MGFIETVDTGVVSYEADTQRQRKYTNKRIPITDVFLGNDHMWEW